MNAQIEETPPFATTPQALSHRPAEGMAGVAVLVRSYAQLSDLPDFAAMIAVIEARLPPERK